MRCNYCGLSLEVGETVVIQKFDGDDMIFHVPCAILWNIEQAGKEPQEKTGTPQTLH